jgi:hypothetical protein
LKTKITQEKRKINKRKEEEKIEKNNTINLD